MASFASPSSSSCASDAETPVRTSGVRKRAFDGSSSNSSNGNNNSNNVMLLGKDVECGAVTALTVRTMDAQETTLLVDPNSTIFTIKQQLVAFLDAGPESQRLVHKGQEMLDNRTLADYTTDKSATVFSVMKFPGSEFTASMGYRPRVLMRGTIAIPVPERHIDRVVSSILHHRGTSVSEIVQSIHMLAQPQNNSTQNQQSRARRRRVIPNCNATVTQQRRAPHPTEIGAAAAASSSSAAAAVVYDPLDPSNESALDIYTLQPSTVSPLTDYIVGSYGNNAALNASTEWDILPEVSNGVVEGDCDDRYPNDASANHVNPMVMQPGTPSITGASTGLGELGWDADESLMDSRDERDVDEEHRQSLTHPRQRLNFDHHNSRSDIEMESEDSDRKRKRKHSEAVRDVVTTENVQQQQQQQRSSDLVENDDDNDGNPAEDRDAFEEYGTTNNMYSGNEDDNNNNNNLDDDDGEAALANFVHNNNNGMQIIRRRLDDDVRPEDDEETNPIPGLVHANINQDLLRYGRHNGQVATVAYIQPQAVCFQNQPYRIQQQQQQQQQLFRYNNNRPQPLSYYESLSASMNNMHIAGGLYHQNDENDNIRNHDGDNDTRPDFAAGGIVDSELFVASSTPTPKYENCPRMVLTNAHGSRATPKPTQNRCCVIS